ncbi:MAG: hypothetical protein AUK63_2058 [bacterium P3]|nr:MAG: hypothetical protein AUK63_2058 [bacterium P3]KWW33254.1 MAG: hypothetical protein F083_2550 [bacterium F083]
MDSPWTGIKVEDYEGHMRFVKQYDLLNRVFKEQISEHCFRAIGILGIGCGNGLEHIKPGTIVYGYDINDYFLNECNNRHGKLGYKLKLQKIDLTNKNARIESCDLLISNLVVEYIGIFNFTRIINKSKPKCVSVVLQMTFDKDKSISDSPYKQKLNAISSVRSEIFPQDLTSTFELIDYHLQYSKTYEISPFKSFIRLDYSLCNTTHNTF